MTWDETCVDTLIAACPLLFVIVPIYIMTMSQATHLMTMESHHSELIAPLSTGDLFHIWIAGYTARTVQVHPL